MENEKIKISLIIPAHNEEKYIGECLEHAIKNSRGRFCEILVIDNASTDRTKEIAEKYPGVRVVREERKGLTRARQRGFIESKGDLLAYNDADTKMPEHWIDMVDDEFARHKNIGVLSGPYIYHDVPRWQQFLVKLYWHVLALPVYWIIGYMTVGGNFVIKKTVLEKMGGFDTNIEFYGEDTDIARRASKFGKAKFKANFYMYTSGRRIHGEGVLRSGVTYIINYLWIALFKKPKTAEYKDIR